MEDISKLAAKLTLDEKISLLAGVDLWCTVAIPRLGIPAMKVTDGPNGARGAWGDLGPSSALFPVGAALGATWNTDLIEQVGRALAKETRAKGAHVLLGPTVNIHRTPIAGRNFECFSEDPYLTGKIAAAYIRGLQNEGVSACIKHFVCNDQEFQRMSISAEVDERTLREIYLEPFRRALAEAKPWSIMSSYNRLNGTYASENGRLLIDILKEEWGFDGAVISDWKGTYSSEVPVNGLDLEMPGPGRWMSQSVVREAIESGRLTQDQLDDKVLRLLRLMERTGTLAQPEPVEERAENTPEQRAFIRSVARETIVLLKNEKHVLPLDTGRIKKIAVIGELAARPNVMGGGSSRVSPHYVVSPLDGIRQRAGTSIEVRHALGCIVHRRLPGFESGTLTDESGKAGGLTLRIFNHLGFSGKPAFETVTERTNFDWWGPGVPGTGVDQARFCAQLRGSFTARESGKHTFSLTSIGQSRLLLDGEVLIDNWENYEPNLEKTAQRKLEPGKAVKVLVEYRWRDPDDWRYLRLGHWPPAIKDPIAEAVRLARASDAVIVVAGLTNEWESEGFDRVHMDLPRQQDELIEKVAQANPNTIVVLNTGSPVSMPWAGRVPAILQQWYNSQECGNALADILFGDQDASGRLPTTFPLRYEDNPTIESYPGKKGKVFYQEGLLVGYRHYDAREIEPLFPFGHGLSYTSFEYSGLSISTGSDPVEVKVDVLNAGKRAGKEVVQLYVHDQASRLPRPEQELKAFAKIELQPGESRTVRFQLGQDAFRFFDPVANAWVVEPGEFEIRVGRSSRDMKQRALFNLPAAFAEAPVAAGPLPMKSIGGN